VLDLADTGTEGMQIGRIDHSMVAICHLGDSRVEKCTHNVH
jgi:hypothetical protein